jgi:hypothetical protein
MAACLVGWAHSPFGRFDHEELASLIVGVTQRAWREALAMAGVFNMGGSAVASYVSILEAAR